jgi:hypothetical protein
MESDMPESSGKSRVDKLDEAFLFLISLTSIIFTVIQAFFGGLAFILYSILLLIFGVVMPFYCGYLKGALEDSAIMRVRGWIYLFIGTAGYVTMLIYFKAGETKDLLIMYTSLIIYTLSLAIIFRICYYILYYIFKICNKELSEFDVTVARYTVVAGASFLLSLLLLLFHFLNLGTLSSLLSSTVSISFYTLIVFFFTLIILTYGIFHNLYCRKIMEDYERLCCEIVFCKGFLERHGRFIRILRLLLFFLMIVLFSMSFVQTLLLKRIPLLLIPAMLVAELGLLVTFLSSQMKIYKRKVTLKRGSRNENKQRQVQRFHFSLKRTGR